MTTDRLAALLHDTMCGGKYTYHVSEWPCDSLAARLRVNGVTAPAQPAECLDCDMNPGCCDTHDAQPDDVPSIHDCCPFCGTPGRYVTADEGTSYFAPEVTVAPAGAAHTVGPPSVTIVATAAPLDEALRFAKAITEYGAHHGNCPYDSWNKSFSRCKCGLFRLVKDAEKLLAATLTPKEADRG